MNVHAPEVFNNAKLLGNFESGSKDWHAVRKNSIGGSEIGTILGLNKWESPYYLWATKSGNIPPKELNSFAVTLGNVLEPVIIDTLLPMKHPDWEIYRTGTYQHPTVDFMHANPDALAKINGEWVIVEVKTSRNYWNQVPANYVSQVMHYMNIMGVKKAVICGLVAMDWVEHWIDFDEFEAAVIEQRAAEFWKLVQDNEQPTFDGSDSTYEAVREMNPFVDGSEVEIDGIHELALLQAKADQAELKLKKAKSQVLSSMGSAQYAYLEVDGERIKVASRQGRKGSKPFLVITKGKK